MKASLIIALLAAALHPSMSKAETKKPFTLQVSSQTEENLVLLKIKIKDVAPHNGVCPYFVKNFSYDTEKKNLKIEVYKEFCANDQFGQSQGVSYWVVPRALVGSKLCVTVNESQVGSVLIQGNKRSYRILDQCE